MKKNIFTVALLSFIFAFSLLFDLKLAVVLLLMMIFLITILRYELAIVKIYFFIYLVLSGYADKSSFSLSGNQSINLLGIINIILILFFYFKLMDFRQLKIELWNKNLIYPIFLFMLYLVLTVPFSLSLTASIRGLSRILSALSFYLLTYFIIVNNKNAEVKIYKFITAIFVLLLICGIIEYFTGFNFFYSRSILTPVFDNCQVIEHFARIHTSFKHSPGYSFALLIFLPLYLYFFIKKKKNRYFYGLIVFLFLINILLTFTRITWIAVFIQLLFFLFLFRPKKILRFSLPIGIIAVFMSGQIINRATTVDSSALGRLELFQYALSLFKSHPIFGCGIGMFFELSEIQFSENIAAHGDYMLMFAEAGVFGGLGYVILLSSRFVFAVKKLKENDFAKVAFLMIIGFMIYGITGNALAHSHIFWGLLGIYNGIIVRENVQNYALSPVLVRL